ncbi:tetratricopeptide repeat protein [Roseobacter sp.]|uniref:tetratricopeptide repeat protein n=1 Tax=Roseobacter sp. TaxID=1907202 RepID=UPI00385FA281
MAAGLLRPFIVLGQSDEGPIFAQSIAHYWHAFDSVNLPRFALQRTLPRRFRSQALTELGQSQYIAEDPRLVPSDLRTQKWDQMCVALDRWQDLSNLHRSRLVLLLHALCFYEVIPKLLPALSNDDLTDPIDAQLSYLRASAVYVLGLPNRVSDYGHADLSSFAHMARSPNVAPQVGFDAAIKILTHLAKNGGSETELTTWQDCASEHLSALHRLPNAFDATLCESRFHRAAAFIPQRRGHQQDVVKVMDAAEAAAKALKPANEAQELLRRENLHPLLESRTKEAIWLGDHDAALERAHQVTQVDPFEARGWLELGQVLMARKDFSEAANAYVKAAMIGPPASAIAYHMAGICYLELDQPVLAALLLKSAVDLDPGAVSTRHHIRELPDDVILQELKKWSLRTAQF